jgi:hypothetical protein
MGRGRAKAKQVKVARQLKYNSGGMDLDRLRADLDAAKDQRNGDYDSDHAGYGEDEDSAEEYEDEDDDDSDDAWGKSAKLAGRGLQYVFPAIVY